MSSCQWDYFHINTVVLDEIVYSSRIPGILDIGMLKKNQQVHLEHNK